MLATLEKKHTVTREPAVAYLLLFTITKYTQVLNSDKEIIDCVKTFFPDIPVLEKQFLNTEPRVKFDLVG